MIRVVFILLMIPSLLMARTIRVAALYSTTFPAGSSFGFGPQASCMTKAVFEDAKKGGMDVSLESFDIQSNPITAGLVAKQITLGNYDAAIGTLVSFEGLAAAQVFESAGIPFVAPTPTHPGITEGRKFVTRIPFNDKRQAQLLAKLTATELKPKIVAVVRNTSNPYSDFLGKEYQANLRRLGPNITVYDFPIIEGFKDVPGLVRTIHAKKPDIIFVPVLQDTLASMYSELLRLKARLTLLGSDIVESDANFVETIGNTSPSIKFIFVQHWNRKFDAPLSGKFRDLNEKYCPQYHPSMVSAAAFDASTALISAIRSSREFSRDKLIPMVKELKFVGVTGPLVYGEDGDPIKPLQLFTVEKNKTVYWKEYR